MIHETNSKKGTVANMENKTKKYRLVKTTTEVIEIEVNQTEFFKDYYVESVDEETEEEMLTTLKGWFADDELDYDIDGDYGIKITHMDYGTPIIDTTKLS